MAEWKLVLKQHLTWGPSFFKSKENTWQAQEYLIEGTSDEASRVEKLTCKLGDWCVLRNICASVLPAGSFLGSK